jgi:hypothetical protein
MLPAKEDQEAAYAKFLKNAMGSLPASMPLGDLDNDVHPLFQQTSFYIHNGKVTIEDIDSSTYQAMLPMLHLASLLITEPAMLEGFDHLGNGFATGDAHGICTLPRALWSAPRSATSMSGKSFSICTQMLNTLSSLMSQARCLAGRTPQRLLSTPRKSRCLFKSYLVGS